MKRMLQQGDVLIKSVKEMPSGKAVEKKNGCFVLAEGEMTGHARNSFEQQIFEESIRHQTVLGALSILYPKYAKKGWKQYQALVVNKDGRRKL